MFGQLMTNNGGDRANTAGSSSSILTYTGIFYASFEAFNTKSDFVYVPMCMCVCMYVCIFVCMYVRILTGLSDGGRVNINISLHSRISISALPGFSSR